MAPDEPYRLAFSRPGLLTFKIVRENEDPDPQSAPLAQLSKFDLPPKHWLIRQSGFALGQLTGEQAEDLAEQTIQLAGQDWDAVHVFSRDRDLPGSHGYEPGSSILCSSIADIMLHKLPKAVYGACPPGANVLDIILAEPNQWIIGCHRAVEIHQQWPGGAFPLTVPEHIVSRAYRKTAEAVAWSQLPIQPGDKIVEIGSSPGGASQRLLDLGLVVTGIDPAEMDPLILEHPRFTHWRGKSSGIKRKMYRGFRWLTADANVAPNYTLDAIEDIVTYPTSRFEGLLLTLKLSSYELADQMEGYVTRIRGWGFPEVKVRQLASNRRECCVVASRRLPDQSP